MFHMTRLTLLLAAVLAVAPSAARAQPGSGSPGARPSQPVDECGKPASARPRRGAASPSPSAGTAAATRGPRVLGTPVGESASAAGTSATAGPAASGGQSTAATAGTGNPQSAGSSATGTAAATGTAGSQSTATAAGTGNPQSASAPTTAGTASGSQPTATTAAAGNPQSAGSAAAGPAASTATAAGTNPQQGAYSATEVTTQGSSTSVETAQSSTSAGSQFLSSGDSVVNPREAKRNRDALRLGLNEFGDRKRLGPAASVSVPTAFGVDGGEMFFGVAYQGRTRFTKEDDAAGVVGFGIGTRRVVALEAALTTYSTLRSYPFETGGLSFKVHRALPRQTSVAVGWENAIRWGGGDDEGSLYAAATKLVTLRDDPDAAFSSAVFTLGVGNGRFRFEEDYGDDKETVNLFAAAGARVNPYVSLVADWTGQDLNAAASVTPLRHIPLVVTVGLADLAGTAGDGARFILSLGYGLALRQPF
jgi:hypothetical protein